MPPRPSFLRGSRPSPRLATRPRWEPRRTNSTAASHTTLTAIDEPPIHPQPYPLPQNAVHVKPRRSIAEAKPFSHFLTDTFARQHDYLRISVTERCNLRCTYCMPEEGVPLSQPEHLLTTPEIVYLSALFVSQGVNKIRLTGGEPTVRKDIVSLMQQIGNLRGKGLRELCLTTNGIAMHRKLDAMAEAGLTGVNLSLDTLDPFQFQIMTRRKGFDAVIRTIDRILEMKRLGAGIKLKINCVVMRGINERDIIPFVEMGREKDIEVRFIEYMPFDGNKWNQKKMLSFKEMLSMIREKYPALEKVQDHANDTSKTYRVPGFVGKLGFITSMTHNFCGSCNRLRITSDGSLKVCLFGNTEVSLRDVLRKGNGGQPFDSEAMEALKRVEMDRKQALPGALGPLGFGERERELLEIIGMAVKRKKEKHAGMGELENMKNRPMILIDEPISNILPTNQASYQRERILFPLKRPPVSPINSLFQLPGMFAPHTYSSSNPCLPSTRSLSTASPYPPSMPHLNARSEAHIVDIVNKPVTHRVAVAQGDVVFSSPDTYISIQNHLVSKGDVLSIARIAGLQAAKKTSDIIPLAHSGLTIECAEVQLDLIALDPNFKSRPQVIGPAAAPQRKHVENDKPHASERSTRTSTSVNSPSKSADPTNDTSKQPDTKAPKPETTSQDPSASHPMEIDEGSTATESSAPASSSTCDSKARTTQPQPRAASIPFTAINPPPRVPIPAHAKPMNLPPSAAPIPDGALAISLGPYGGVRITCLVGTTAKTGVEMEALTGVMGAALTVIDMIKGNDRGAFIQEVKVIGKKGGRSGAHGCFAQQKPLA